METSYEKSIGKRENSQKVYKGQKEQPTYEK